MSNRDLELLRHLDVIELNQKKRRGTDMNKRDLGNKHPKKKCCSCLALHKEVNEYWNIQKRKPNNEEEKGQETCSD